MIILFSRYHNSKISLKGSSFESKEDVSTHGIKVQKVISSTVSEPGSDVGVPSEAKCTLKVIIVAKNS